jgi:hypothetical protein
MSDRPNKLLADCQAIEIRDKSRPKLPGSSWYCSGQTRNAGADPAHGADDSARYHTFAHAQPDRYDHATGRGSDGA